MRVVQNIKKGRRDKYGAETQSVWHTHINGALGEVAVAKYLGRYWDGMGALGDLHAADVGGGVQVRWTGKPNGDLILHPSDADDKPFVLVTGDAPRFTLHGWILGRDGKLETYWRDPAGGRAAFFVPQNKLVPIAELAAWLTLAA